MEAKLLAYRRQQKRQLFIENCKAKLRKMFLSTDVKEKRDDVKIEISDRDREEEENENSSAMEQEPLLSSSEEEVPEQAVAPVILSKEDKFWKYALYVLSFIFWLTCYAIFIQLQFGLVYLLFSALFGIYFNTRTRPKQKNEISAYSVFNKNVLAIDGTLNAEQFEREIRYGSTSVR